MATLPEQLERLEERVSAAGGTVHWARDGEEANAIIASIAQRHGADEVIKVKSLATDEIGLNEALEARGITPIETDLAELIVQLGDDEQSHILVPAIHRNRAEIAALFERTIAPGQELGLEPTAIAEAARRHLREKFLTVPVAISGANFGVAETGTIGVVESEGNGRMCTTLPKVLVTLMGIEKVLPEWRDLEVMLQLLPRSSTAERMNPYTSLWRGVREGDGPEEFHLVLLDAGRTDVLADEVGRQALHCIRCSACLNVCPVYSRVGGHAYESVYPGPIGAILTPQLQGLDQAPDAAVGLLAVRRLLRRLPGEDRHPDRARAPARPRRARGEVALRAGAAGDGRHRPRLPLPPRVRAGAAPRPGGPRAAAARALARLEHDARPAGGAGALLPRVVGAGASRGRHRGRRHRPGRHDGAVARRMSAREDVLGRIRTALGAGTDVPDVPRDYHGAGAGAAAGDPAVVARFCERAAEYRATVRRVGAANVADAVAAALAEHGARRVAVSPGAPPSGDAVERVPDDPPLSPRDLDALDGVLTGCAAAIAETGTVVLDGGARSGRRLLTLVPDLHVCVVEAADVHDGVPDAIAALAGAAAEGRPLTLVSGPSATSDIELERVEGVHGPRTLVILVVEP